MELIKTSNELNQRLSAARGKGKSIGFVPTMGALHQGHLSLVEEAGRGCDLVVVSVFVNPTQFNDPKDLDRYPRDLDADMEMLAKSPCELVFAPSVEEVYPKPDTRVFDFGQLEEVMEGKHRPGHFNGVAQVVSRLFDMVKPDKAFFGQKDFQQMAIVRDMVQQLNLGTDIVACPIVRESDGLAMSSRNRLLTKKHRKSAPLIAKTLSESCNFVQSKKVADAKTFVENVINSDDNLELEYFEIVDGQTLQPVDNWAESNYIVGCIAVFAGEIRLIDNVIYKIA
ncbi:pantoate--beta-alanine ligase [Marinilabilia rubra]|uniref:Pantothenate synthetase n=1 Tax=Marinilabilia rubra TaxID=2162893 RepID=A0A2U2BBT5_9BACT|nr:pantoate--beta-alanine ligase [Marinilabilia rubra]PWE00534.1 pantoate--beta-alanine ligase [Marinilabilia rubra]